MKIKTLLLVLFFITTAGAFAQSTITGTVVDESNMPLPGAEVTVNGKTNYAVTDFDGLFSLEASQGDVLTIRYLGFKSKEVTVGTETTITVVLQQDASELDEVVVIGYGTQKKADLTGSIVQVDAETVAKTPTSNINQALQGKIAGVQVTSAGAPGQAATIKLRGVGSYTTDANPLYVVDGMYYTDINFLNTADIESVNVLKDASSTAIFGVKAAGGVIIIKTKSGGYNKKSVFTYEGYGGVQVAQNVLKMANAEQFVTMAYESGSSTDVANVLAAMQRYGRSRINPNVPDVNTDWYKEIMTTAPIMSHSMNFTGGSSNVSYAVGVNYFTQDGILDHTRNEYERFNLRSKIDAKFTERFKVGTNFIFSNATQYLAEGSAWNLAYFAVPIMPVFDESNDDAAPYKLADARDIGYRGSQNPFVPLLYNDNRYRKRDVLANVYAEYDLVPEKLSFKTSYNVSYRPTEERFMNRKYTLLTDNLSSLTIANRVGESTVKPGFSQIWDNTLTYNESFGDHHLTVLAGSSFRDEAYSYVSATGYNVRAEGNEDNWIINNTDTESRTSSSYSSRVYASSYFGRAQYNYKDKYLLNATFRAEGTSKYTNDQWGYFPSVGAGWVVSEEDFFKDNKVINFLKLRASWGRNGNDKVSPSSGGATVSTITAAIDDVQYTGTVVASTASDLRWEFIEETDFGVNARFFDNKLSLEADYYIRDTKDAVIPVYQRIISSFVNQNVGSIRNSGFEISADWTQNISDKFRFTIGGNLGTLKNEILDLYSADYIDGGSAEFRQRSMVGEPINAFYGYEIAGVYQNDAEVAADPVAVANNLVPGDFKYKDLNGDGAITDDDRKVLGSYLPKITYGANLGVTYGNFDFSMSIYGQGGNKILNRKRGEMIWTPDQNMDADLAINRWHGEGTSNSYPSSAGLRKGWNQKLSNFYIENGDFFRIQNIQLAYTLKGANFLGAAFPETRFFVTAERPYTSFSYNGFNPEVGNGIDTQTYPIPAIYTVGLNIKI